MTWVLSDVPFSYYKKKLALRLSKRHLLVARRRRAYIARILNVKDFIARKNGATLTEIYKHFGVIRKMRKRFYDGHIRMLVAKGMIKTNGSYVLPSGGV